MFTQTTLLFLPSPLFIIILFTVTTLIVPVVVLAAIFTRKEEYFEYNFRDLKEQTNEISESISENQEDIECKGTCHYNNLFREREV
jgi:hypothetical protein